MLEFINLNDESRFEKLIARLNMMFPFIARDAVSYNQHSDYDLEVTMRDGSKIFYDDLDGTFRNLPANSNEMSEVQCRAEFGARLRRMMILNGISQIELSEAADISPAQLNRYITGKVTPSFYIVDKIAKALGCSTDEFRYI